MDCDGTNLSQPEEECIETPKRRKIKNQNLVDFLQGEAEKDEKRHEEMINIEREKMEIERERLQLLRDLLNVLDKIE